MHVVNRTDLPDCDTLPPGSPDPCIDLAEIQSIIRNQGESSCMLCHGTNGAQPGESRSSCSHFRSPPRRRWRTTR
jgi:hypothetical protein